jgi:hypothetical protein
MLVIQVGIRSYKTLFPHLTAAIIILILVCSGILTNTTYAQVSLKPDQSVINNSNTTTSQSQQRPYEVKITSPNKGQHVQAGKDLVISGTSGGNATSGCQVSVIVNGIKPYQNATPTGSRGPGEYSKWSFVLTPKYSSLKEGQNKITAKLSCGNDLRPVPHNSVNVTGVPNTTNSIVNTNQAQKHQNQESLARTIGGNGGKGGNGGAGGIGGNGGHGTNGQSHNGTPGTNANGNNGNGGVGGNGGEGGAGGAGGIGGNGGTCTSSPCNANGGNANGGNGGNANGGNANGGDNGGDADG